MLILVSMEILADFNKLFQINVGTKPRLYCPEEWKKKVRNGKKKYKMKKKKIQANI